MNQNRKLQVFVSSTFSDLKSERQAAVEAILAAKHIPAGMELFTAGNRAQMKVIEQWIDDSDIYMLILGGRYGSIDPKTGKSYTHLEYEYASKKKKPLFAVVLTEDFIDRKVATMGKEAIENENPKELKQFTERVKSKLVALCEDEKDIRLEVIKSLKDFESNDKLIGWIRGDQSVDQSVTEELARLSSENSKLKVRLEESTVFEATYTQEELIQVLISQEFNHVDADSVLLEILTAIADRFKHTEINLLHYLILIAEAYKNDNGIYLPVNSNTSRLTFYELIMEGLASKNRKMQINLTDSTKKILKAIDNGKLKEFAHLEHPIIKLAISDIVELTDDWMDFL